MTAAPVPVCDCAAAVEGEWAGIHSPECALAQSPHLGREDERETLEAVLSRAMDLIDDAIGTIDKQTYDPKQELDLPEDAEHHVIITQDEKRKLDEAWHLLSGRLKALRRAKEVQT